MLPSDEEASGREGAQRSSKHTCIDEDHQELVAAIALPMLVRLVPSQPVSKTALALCGQRAQGRLRVRRRPSPLNG